MASIFINYRRDDSQGAAFSLQSHLAKEFGRRRVFIDIHGLSAGSEFDIELDRQIQACSAMVVMIGPYWLKYVEDGTRRIDNPNDFVRIEIAKAIALRKPILPVCVGEAKMPEPEDLPDEIRDLPRYNGRPLRFERFEADADEIAEALRSMIRRGGASPYGVSHWWMAAAVAGGMAVGAPAAGLHWEAGSIWPKWKGSVLSAMQTEVDDLREVNAKLRANIEHLAYEKEAAVARAVAAETDDEELLAKLHARTEELLKARQSRETDRQKFDRDLTTLIEQRNQFARAARDSNQRVTELEASLADVQAERDEQLRAMTRVSVELEDRDRQFRELMEEFDRTKLCHAALPAQYDAEFEALKRRAADAEARAAAAAERAADLEARLAAAAATADRQAEVAAQLAALQAKYDALAVERDESQVHLASLTAERSDREEALQQQLGTLEAQQAERQAAMEDLQARLQVLERERKGLLAARDQACAKLLDISNTVPLIRASIAPLLTQCRG